MLMKRPAARAHGLKDDDAGIGLVETIVSLAITMVVLVAIAGLLVGATRAGMTSRADSNASNILNEQVEEIRSLDYGAVTLITSDSSLATDPAIVQGTPWTYEGKPLVINPTGSVGHIVQESRNNVTYTTRRYVTTDPTDTTGSYKIATLLVTWKIRDVEHTKSVQTMVSQVQRGLPLPRFEIGPKRDASLLNPNPDAVVFGAGTRAYLSLWLRNAGARDTWNVVSMPSGWTFVWDTNANGKLDAGEDDLSNRLTDSTGDGVPDTGPVQNGQTVNIIAFRDVTVTDSTMTPVFRFTSASHPSVFKGVTARVDVTGALNPICISACTLTGYYLKQAAAGDQVSAALNLLWEQLGAPSTNPPTFQASGFNYSSEALGDTGRLLVPSTSGTLQQRKAHFEFAVPKNETRTYQGNGRATVYVVCAVGNTAIITGRLGSAQVATPPATPTYVATSIQTVVCTGAPQEVMFQYDLTGSAFAISSPKQANKPQNALVMDLTVTGSPVRLHYDEPGAPSVLIMPVK